MFVNANSMVQHVIQIKNVIIKHVNLNVKIIINAKKIIVEILEYVFVRIANIWKVLLILPCDEIITAMDIVSTKMTNTIATNVKGTASVNFHSKNVKDCYILHTVLLVTTLLLIIIIICYYYAKQEGINALAI